MKKSILLLFVALATLLEGCQIEDFEFLRGEKNDGVDYQFDRQNNTALVTGCSKERTTPITIPAKIRNKGKDFEVTSIANEAFVACNKIPSITIPRSVTSIGNEAFRACYGLTEVNIAKHSLLTFIGEQAFSSCNHLTNITIPESVKSIGEKAFCNCSSLTEITIPKNSQLTSIGEGAFFGCSTLSSIIIPTGMTYIGDRAFCNCHNLIAINIPKEMTYIGESAFGGCSNLTTIICEATTPPSVGDYPFNHYYGATLYVPAEAVRTYKYTYPWSEFDSIQAF